MYTYLMTNSKTYQMILGAINSKTCTRDDILTTIDVAFENGDLTTREARLLEAAAG